MRFEPPKPLSALKVFDLGRIKDDLDIAGELQQVSGFPVWKSQAALRIDQEVAQRVEEPVAGKIRNRDDAVRTNPHKTRFAAAMRDIDLPVAGFARDIGCNEQSVRALDQCAYAIVCHLLRNTWFGRRLRGITGEGELPHLDVLRTIAVALFDNQIEPSVIVAVDRPVQPIAAAGEQIDPQQPQAIAILHAGIGRIARIARDADAQSMRAGRPHEARAATAERCPSIPRRIDRAQDDEWEQRKELAMLVDQVIADCSLADLSHPIGNTDTALHRYFTGMPSRDSSSLFAGIHSEHLSNGRVCRRSRMRDKKREGTVRAHPGCVWDLRPS